MSVQCALCFTWCVLSTGDKVSFMVTDPSKFTAQGDGLGLVRVNKTASFNVCAPCAQIQDVGVSIAGLCFIHLGSSLGFSCDLQTELLVQRITESEFRSIRMSASNKIHLEIADPQLQLILRVVPHT